MRCTPINQLPLDAVKVGDQRWSQVIVVVVLPVAIGKVWRAVGILAVERNHREPLLGSG